MCPAGVPQWPDTVLDGHCRGWRESSAEGPVHWTFCRGWQGRSTIPKQPETDEDERTLERTAVNLFPAAPAL